MYSVTSLAVVTSTALTYLSSAEFKLLDKVVRIRQVTGLRTSQHYAVTGLRTSQR